jgi:membrane protein DedA with SNARE-associated domain
MLKLSTRRPGCTIAGERALGAQGDFSMTLVTLIETHGYWVLAIGCLLEGETVLVLAGFAAHRGYLDPFVVFGLATTMGFFGDQFYFWLGRHHGPAVLARWPSVARQSGQLDKLLLRYHAGVIIGIRFAYGLRIAGPVLMGMSLISAYRFVFFNALGALLWAALIGSLGWVFGHAAEVALGDIRNLEFWLLLAVGGLGLLIWWFRKWRAR